MLFQKLSDSAVHLKWKQTKEIKWSLYDGIGGEYLKFDLFLVVLNVVVVGKGKAFISETSDC